MIYESRSKKEDNGKPINTKNLERGISIQKKTISKLTSQFVSGQSGSSKPQGECVRLKNMELCLNPELKTQINYILPKVVYQWMGNISYAKPNQYKLQTHT